MTEPTTTPEMIAADASEINQAALSYREEPVALTMSNVWLNDAAPKQVFRERGLQLLMFEERMRFNDDKTITFSSSYFCCEFLEGRDNQVASLKDYGMLTRQEAGQ